jgi:predicted tellurium resistance membrane protein TerC
MRDDDPVRFGAEFGPHRTKRASGVSLSTFKTLVWVSNLGGLILFAIGMELMIRGSFWFGIACIVIGITIALFPSNYEIVGMEETEVEEWEKK